VISAILDVEFAVLALLEAVRPRHDHRAQRVAALDVGIVVDLDALGRRVQSESFRHAVEQLALRGILGQAPAELLARVGERHFHDLALLAALRRGDLDLAIGVQAQRLGQHSRLGMSSESRISAGAGRSS
jgi:hypothetical protein